MAKKKLRMAENFVYLTKREAQLVQDMYDRSPVKLRNVLIRGAVVAAAEKDAKKHAKRLASKM